MRKFTPLEYLYIAIANAYGLDRKVWDERLAFVHDNHSSLEGLDTTAKEPVMFRKAVRALRDVEANKPTPFPMGMDATASGLQNMACMTGCKLTAEATNLTNNGLRNCVYDTTAKYMSTLGLPQTRDTMKQPVMITFYGSVAGPRDHFGKGTAALDIFYKTMKERLPGAWNAMNIMNSFWNPTATHYRWNMPDGHTVIMPVINTVERTLEIDELNHLRVNYKTRVIQPLTHSRALAANIVHSIDGYVCRQMVLRAHRQGFWMAPVHDCFFASPKYMNKVRQNYIDIMVNLARSSIFSSILTQIAGHKIEVIKRSNDLHTYIANAEYPLS